MKNAMILLSLLWIASELKAQNEWQQVPSGTKKKLLAISFADERTGYIAGSDSLILKTTDGGTSWSFLPYTGIDFPGSTRDLIDIQFIHPDTGYVIAGNEAVPQYNGVLYRTTDGGHTWQAWPAVAPNIAAYRCHMFDTKNGYLAGSTFFAGKAIARYKAEVWQPVQYMGSNPLHFLRSLDFRNKDRGIAGGDNGNFHRTMDGGVTWDTVYSGTDSSLFAVRYINDSLLAATSNYIHSPLLFSKDSGKTWQADPNILIFQFPVFRDLAHSKRDSIVMVGKETNFHKNGIIAGLRNQGWYTQTTSHPLNRIGKRNDHIIFIVGDSGQIYTNKSAVLRAPAPEKPAGPGIYPNPAQNYLSVDAAGSQIRSIHLSNYEGKTIRSFSPSVHRLDISGIAAGMYWIVFETAAGNYTRPVIIQP